MQNDPQATPSQNWTRDSDADLRPEIMNHCPHLSLDQSARPTSLNPLLTITCDFCFLKPLVCELGCVCVRVRADCTTASGLSSAVEHCTVNTTSCHRTLVPASPAICPAGQATLLSSGCEGEPLLESCRLGVCLAPWPAQAGSRDSLHTRSHPQTLATARLRSLSLTHAPF